jgi:predicted DNA-binding protein YlxM (UPF0122 family)
MVNILFYGNCQLEAVLKTLNLPNNHKCLIECFSTNINKEEFTNIIKNSDIIITQPVEDNYRNTDYLSSSYVVNNSKNTCKILFFNNCHFDFYYFDLTYKKWNDTFLDKPNIYHYNKMIECYNNNLSANYYVNKYVNNLGLKTSTELEMISENSLHELQKRYTNMLNTYNNKNTYFIPIHDFIQNNYKNKLLFYSMNHPSKYLIQHICKQIVDTLQIESTINYNIDFFGNTKCILYKCIQKHVRFNVDEHLPLLLNNSNVYEITKMYYNEYKKIEKRE